MGLRGWNSFSPMDCSRPWLKSASSSSSSDAAGPARSPAPAASDALGRRRASLLEPLPRSPPALGPSLPQGCGSSTRGTVPADPQAVRGARAVVGGVERLHLRHPHGCTGRPDGGGRAPQPTRMGWGGGPTSLPPTTHRGLGIPVQPWPPGRGRPWRRPAGRAAGRGTPGPRHRRWPAGQHQPKVDALLPTRHPWLRIGFAVLRVPGRLYLTYPPQKKLPWVDRTKNPKK